VGSGRPVNNTVSRNNIFHNWRTWTAYFDVGTGTSRYTYQAMAGAGYRFGFGDVSLAYRHLQYKFGDDFGLKELTFSGPILGATFRF